MIASSDPAKDYLADIPELSKGTLTDGFIKESKDDILVPLKHYRQEPEHQMLAEYVVEKFTKANIFNNEVKRLLMKVV